MSMKLFDELYTRLKENLQLVNMNSFIQHIESLDVVMRQDIWARYIKTYPNKTHYY